MDPRGRVTPDAIVLAGGRASRLGGIDKPRIEIGGRTLLDGLLDALAAAGCDRIVIAGPEALDDDGAVSGAPAPDGGSTEERGQSRRTIGPDVRWVREDPPFGGPVAGIAAALPLVTTHEVVVLAGDLTAPAEALALLLHPDAPHGVDGRRLTDPDGRSQPLTAVYAAAALRANLAALPGGGRDASMRRLLEGLALADIDASAAAVHDVDTWEDIEDARRTAAGRKE